MICRIYLLKQCVHIVSFTSITIHRAVVKASKRAMVTRLGNVRATVDGCPSANGCVAVALAVVVAVVCARLTMDGHIIIAINGRVVSPLKLSSCRGMTEDCAVGHTPICALVTRDGVAIWARNVDWCADGWWWGYCGPTKVVAVTECVVECVAECEDEGDGEHLCVLVCWKNYLWFGK